MVALLAEMAYEYPRRGLHSHPETGRPEWGCWTGPSDEQQAWEWLAGQDRGWHDGDWLTFAVFEQHESVPSYCLAGHVGLKSCTRGDRLAQSESAEVSYWIAAAARGRGVATAALTAVTAWAFENFATTGLVQIKLVHDLDNHASCRVADKSGYAFQKVSPANPPLWFTAGHIHTRSAGAFTG